MLRKRKPISNQELTKRQKVDDVKPEEEIRQNWKKILGFVKRLSDSEGDIKLLKSMIRTISSKPVSESHKDIQLDVWLEIIHYLIRVKENSKDIQDCFKYLKIHKIGRKNTKLYIEWAEFERNQGNIEKAKNVILLGMEYGAQPEQLLKSKLNAYQDLLNQTDSEQTYFELNSNHGISKIDDYNGKDLYNKNDYKKNIIKDDKDIDNKNIYKKDIFNDFNKASSKIKMLNSNILDNKNNDNNNNNNILNEKENYIKGISFNKSNYIKDTTKHNKEIINKDTSFDYLKDTSFKNDILYDNESHDKDIFNKIKHNKDTYNEDLYDKELKYGKNVIKKEPYEELYNKESDRKELYNKELYSKDNMYNNELYSNELLKKKQYNNELYKKENVYNKELFNNNESNKNETYIKDFYNNELYSKENVYSKKELSNLESYSKEFNKKSYDKENIYNTKELSNKESNKNDSYNKELYNKELYNDDSYNKENIYNKELPSKESIFNNELYNKKMFKKENIYSKEQSDKELYNNDYIYNKGLPSKELYDKEHLYKETHSDKILPNNELYEKDLYNDESYLKGLNLKNMDKENTLENENDPFKKKSEVISKEIDQIGKEISILSSGTKDILTEEKININYSALKNSRSDDIINEIFSNKKKNVKIEKDMDYINTPLPLSQQKRNYSGSSSLLSLKISPIQSSLMNDNKNSNNVTNNSNNSNSSNSSNSILNSINTSSQNILSALTKNNISSNTKEANSIYSTPYSHYNKNISPILSISHSQPRSNYVLMSQNQRNNEEYVEPYSFEMPLNDVKSESYSLQSEINISQQIIDNIPRSIIQYIYSLLSKGSTVFMCNEKRYMSLEQIGRGGTSKVYKVLSQEGKILALKKIDINGSDKAAINGYVNEINLLNHLKNNSRIIQLVDAEINRETNSIYMVMECGEIDLAKLLQKEGKKISISSIKMYWEQMLKAVHAIHEENIIHSDLKPANFLLVGGALKLIDFGIAKAIPNDTTNIHRDVQTGTVNYMSPESISDSGYNNSGDSNQRLDFKISRASDVWSLGCILYQMVYGKPPFFKENNIFMKFKAIVNVKYQIAFSSNRNQFQLESSQDQASLSNENENNNRYDINNFVSSPLLEVMRLCLQREPKKRPTIPQLLQQAFIHAPQVSYNLIHNLVEEMLDYCNKEDDPSKISDVLYKQIMKQGSY